MHWHIDQADRDLVGKVINNWKLIDKAPCRGNNAYWRAECQGCGELKEVSWQSIKNGRSKGCRDCAGLGFEDLSGQTFDQWLVLGRPIMRRPGKNTEFVCKCSCGKTSLVASQKLRDGKSTRCRSCAAKEREKAKAVKMAAA